MEIALCGIAIQLFCTNIILFVGFDYLGDKKRK